MVTHRARNHNQVGFRYQPIHGVDCSARAYADFRQRFFVTAVVQHYFFVNTQEFSCFVRGRRGVRTTGHYQRKLRACGEMPSNELQQLPQPQWISGAARTIAHYDSHFAPRLQAFW